MLRFFRVLSIFAFVALSAFSAFAQEKIQVKDIRCYELSERLRVVIETTGISEFVKGELKNPERLFFDIKNASLNKELKKEYSVNSPVVSKIRVGQFDANTVRIVFDLKKPDYEFKIIQLEDPFRMVIDIYPRGNAKSSIKSDDGEVKNILKRKIVIDPGHGGKDPGAIGPSGLKEKDVTLDIALKVKELLKNEPSFEVILTRDRDVFIPLNERTEIANRLQADLFISIHANASSNSYARGIETYILNWTDDEEAIR
ncbi:MAG: N-acetylmuramoyl-L-alanine amidase, partial [Thermodesulfovibrio sp.]